MHRLRRAASGLDPSYFAFVMATGVVSIDMRNHGLSALSVALLWLAAAGYAVLVALTVARAVWAPRRLWADLTDAGRGFGFFTFVAATDVLGTRLVAADHRGAAIGLLVVGCLSWIALGYLVPWTAVLGGGDRPLIAAANGSWFVWAVASQSVAVLATGLEPTVSTGREDLAFLAVFQWAVGMFLYAAAGVFIAARLLAYPLRPVDLTPSYWVAMGGTAITVLAGARILQMAPAPTLSATRNLVGGVSVGFWAFGTWLIPALVAAGWWRHVGHRVPLRYEPALWSLVFPLAMYSVAGHYLGVADHLPIVRVVGDGEAWVALAVWAVTAAAMIASGVRAGSRAAPPRCCAPGHGS